MAIVNEEEIAGLEPADSEQQLQIPNELPVLPLGENRMILLASQKDLDKEEPNANDLYKVGTAAVIMRMLKLPDGRIRILVQGLARAEVESVDTTGEYIRARLQVVPEVPPPERSL